MAEIRTAPAALASWAEKTPERTFLTQPLGGELRTWSFRQAHQDAARFGAALLALGMERGDRVAILSKNCAEWLIADVAISMAGLVSVPIYPTAGANTIRYVLEHSGARAVIIGRLDDPAPANEAIAADLITIGMRYDEGDRQYDWQTLIDTHEPIAAAYRPDADEMMTILYTSGTTGRP